eukprot:scaffold7249_cov19-Tisochrysis_lutea.AAC.2
MSRFERYKVGGWAGGPESCPHSESTKECFNAGCAVGKVFGSLARLSIQCTVEMHGAKGMGCMLAFHSCNSAPLLLPVCLPAVSPAQALLPHWRNDVTPYCKACSHHRHHILIACIQLLQRSRLLLQSAPYACLPAHWLKSVTLNVCSAGARSSAGWRQLTASGMTRSPLGSSGPPRFVVQLWILPKSCCGLGIELVDTSMDSGLVTICHDPFRWRYDAGLKDVETWLAHAARRACSPHQMLLPAVVANPACTVVSNWDTHNFACHNTLFILWLSVDAKHLHASSLLCSVDELAATLLGCTHL